MTELYMKTQTSVRIYTLKWLINLCHVLLKDSILADLLDYLVLYGNYIHNSSCNYFKSLLLNKGGAKCYYLFVFVYPVPLLSSLASTSWDVF